MDQLIAKMRWEKTSSMMMPPPMNKKVKVNIFVKILEKKNAVGTCADKVIKDANNKKKLPTTNLCWSFERKKQKKCKNTKNIWQSFTS